MGTDEQQLEPFGKRRPTRPPPPPRHANARPEMQPAGRRNLAPLVRPRDVRPSPVLNSSADGNSHRYLSSSVVQGLRNGVCYPDFATFYFESLPFRRTTHH